jgi:hypothetical protein
MPSHWLVFRRKTIRRHSIRQHGGAAKVVAGTGRRFRERMSQEIRQRWLASHRRQRCAGIITDSTGRVTQFPAQASASLFCCRVAGAACSPSFRGSIWLQTVTPFVSQLKARACATSIGATRVSSTDAMSPIGPTATSRNVRLVVAIGCKADVECTSRNARRLALYFSQSLKRLSFKGRHVIAPKRIDATACGRQ